jgi:biotin carboxyl carrier protein
MQIQAIVDDSDPLQLDIDRQRGVFKINGTGMKLDTIDLGAGRFHIVHDSHSYNVEVFNLDRAQKTVDVMVNGKKFSVRLKDRYDDLLQSMGIEISGTGSHRDVKAPMPGMVLEVMVKEGDVVEKDTPLLILEAMKMENVIKSPGPGTISRITSHKGQAVEKNMVLVEFS